MKYHTTKPQTAASFRDANVPAIVNNTPPRKLHNLFSRNSLVFLFCIVAITLLFACKGPAGPQGAQGDRGEKGDTGDQGTPAVLRECHSTLGYPTACYDATTGVLTLTGIDLADVGAAGTTDDIDMSKISVAGKGGTDDAVSLTATPTITKADNSKFTLTLDSADRGSILEKLDRNGTIASDGLNFFIALENDWNGSSSSAISMPIHTTNFPPGYCGDLRADAATRPTLERNVANEFFGGGTGAMDDPLLITMRLYCDTLSLNWNINYTTAGDTKIYKKVTFITAGTYSFVWTHRGLTAGNGQFVVSPDLGVSLAQGFFASDADGDTTSEDGVVATISREQIDDPPLVVTMNYQTDLPTPPGAYVGALELTIRRR